ncbi:MAG TPA: ABC transporter substrate-binding protein [Conexibacter sp.]|nr:ABC transporter substrate-binding protein [Conexibacter sp.]
MVAAALVAAGCGNSSDGGGSTSAGGGEKGGEKVLTIATANDITGVDPAYVVDDQTHELVANVYDIGIGLGEAQTDFGPVMSSSRPVPRAFDRWSISKDGLTYTFHVRQGMKMHDGTLVTPSDVAYSYNRLLGTNSGGRWATNNILKDTKPFRVEGENVIMHADRPSVLATQMLFADTFAIVDKEDVEKHATRADPWAERWLSKNLANASGPYILESHTKDQELVLRAIKDYWAGPPAYDRIVWKIVPSGAERLSLLKAGAVDMAMGLTPQQIASLRGTDGITISDGPTYRQTAMLINTTRPVLGDLKLRQAISYGINYDDIIANSYSGAAVRSNGPVPSGSPFGLPADAGYAYDGDRAKQLLGESGYDGTPISIIYSNDSVALGDVAVRVKSQLEALGIKIRLEPLNNAVYDERQARGKFDMLIDDILAWIPDADYLAELFYKCDAFFNLTKFCDRSVDKAIEDGWSITDHDKRYALFEDAQNKINAQATWVYFLQSNFQVAMRDSVTGFVTPQNVIPIYYNLKPAA